METAEPPYFTNPAGAILSYRDITELAGRRLPYVTGEYRHNRTGFFRGDYVEYLLVTGGEGQRRVQYPDGTISEHAMLPGQLYFFRPMDLHDIGGVGAALPKDGRTGGIGRPALDVVCITFPVETWERFALACDLDQRPFTGVDAPMIEIDLEDPARIRPFRRILTRWQRRLDTVDLIRFLAKTAPWFVEAARADDPTGAPRWLRSAVEAMHEEENLRVGVPRLIELCHVSHTHLWRNTRAYFAMSPTDLVNDIRLHHASLLLSSTDTSIAMIAERCGYSSAGWFSTAFKRSRLVTPRSYRTQSRAR